MNQRIQMLFFSVIVVVFSVVVPVSMSASAEQPTLDHIHRSAQELETLLKQRNEAIAQYNRYIVQYRKEIEALNLSIAKLVAQIQSKAQAQKDTGALRKQLVQLNAKMDETNTSFFQTARLRLQQIYNVERTRQTKQKQQAIDTIVWSYRSVEKQIETLQQKQREEFSKKRALEIFRLDRFVRKVLLSRREKVEQELQQSLVQLNEDETKALSTLNPPALQPR